MIPYDYVKELSKESQTAVRMRYYGLVGTVGSTVAHLIGPPDCLLARHRVASYTKNPKYVGRSSLGCTMV